MGVRVGGAGVSGRRGECTLSLNSVHERLFGRKDLRGEQGGERVGGGGERVRVAAQCPRVLHWTLANAGYKSSSSSGVVGTKINFAQFCNGRNFAIFWGNL